MSVLPGRGERGYFDKIVDWLLVSHNADGTLKPGAIDTAGFATDTDVDAVAADIAVVDATLTVHTANAANPHSVTKTQVGLGDADNTADVDKPISTTTQNALDLKIDEADLQSEVAAAIALDDTVALAAADAAETAVDAEIAGRDLIERNIGVDPSITFAVADADGNASWLATDNGGGIPEHSGDAMRDTVLRGASLVPSMGTPVWAVTDADGNASWLAVNGDGTIPGHSIATMRDALGLAGGGGSITLHVVGDLHVGQSGALDRADSITDDVLLLNGVTDHRVYVGDIVTTPGDTDMLDDAATLLDTWDASSDNRDLVGGNHDYNQFTTDETGSIFMARWGYADRNWYRDIGPIRLIGITSDTIGAGDDWMTIAGADLIWLAARLAETTLRCVIVYHAPLYDTVTNAPFSSTDPNFYAHDNAAILAVLDAHPNAVLWLSGHTHTDIDDPAILTTVDTGTRSIAALNASAIAYVEDQGAGSPLQSPVVTIDGSGIHVRWRGHATGTWLTVGGNVTNSILYLDLV